MIRHPIPALMVAVLVPWGATVCVACGDSAAPVTPSVGVGGQAAAGGQAGAGGGAGLDGPCPPGSQPVGDGECLAAGEGAGIAPEMCEEGFVPDGAGSCDPVLPPEPCPPGTMATPGQTICQPVAPCGEAPWGDIPVEADTQYVDGSYTGGASDGSATKPWTTVQDAIDAATVGAIVAVAAGSYAEDLDDYGQTIRIWGRCPELVTLAGVGGVRTVFLDGPQSEIHTLAITGPGDGLVLAADDGLAEGLWIHDTGYVGMLITAHTTVQEVLIEQAQSAGLLVVGAEVSVEDCVIRNGEFRGVSVRNDGATRAAVTLSGVVVDSNTQAGMFLQGSDALIERSIVRDTRILGDNIERGYGIYAQMDVDLAMRAKVDVASSVIEGNHIAGLLALGVETSLMASVVRDTQPGTDGKGGVGIDIRYSQSTGQIGEATLVHSVVENNHEMGVFVHVSQVEVDHSIVRDTRARPLDDRYGRGMYVQHEPEALAPSLLTVRSCLLERNREAGIASVGAAVLVEATVVRDTYEELASGLFGRGITVQSGVVPDSEPIAATVRWSVLEANHEVGLLAGGHTTLWVDATRVANTLLASQSIEGGWGIDLQHMPGEGRPNGLMTRCLVTGNQGVSVAAMGADLELVDTVVRGTLARGPGQLYGDGIAIVHHGAPSTCTLTGSRIEQVARAGIINAGSELSLSSTSFECNPIDLDGETLHGASPTFVDEGGNQCGCAGEEWSCQATSAQLVAPDPL